MNPTQDVFEKRIAALEGGVAAVALASGQAASTFAVLNLLQAGDHLVSSSSLYGGTYNLFHYTLPKLGIEVSFVDDPDDAEAWKAASRPAQDQGVLRRDARQPARQRPRRRAGRRRRARGRRAAHRRQHRADAVPAAPARARGRHRRALGDQVPRRPRHDDRRRRRRRRHASTSAPTPARFPGFNEPDPSYGGLHLLARARPRLVRREAAHPVPARRRARRSARSARSCSSRASRRCRCGSSGTCRTPRPIAEWLEARDEVEGVHYAGLPSSRWYDAGQKYLPRGAGAIVAFELRGGVEAGKQFVDALELFSHLANIGDVRSLVIHPASTTHSQLTDAGAGEHRRHAGPGAAVGRARGARRTCSPTSRPGCGPRSARDGGPVAPLGARPRAGPGARATRPAAGSFADTGAQRARARRQPAAVTRRVRDVGDAAGRAAARSPTPSWCCTRSPATATSPVRPGRATRPPAGGTPLVGPGRRHRHRPLVGRRARTSSAAARARPARASAAPDGRAYGSRWPALTVRDQVETERRLADALGVRALGAGRRRLDGRLPRARVGGHAPGAGRSGWPRSPRPRRPARTRSACRPRSCWRSGPTPAGRAATTTTPAPAAGRTAGWGSPGGSRT